MKAKKTPQHYMRQVLTLAAEALELGEFPIAAIVVLDGEIIARATASEQRDLIPSRFSAVPEMYCLLSAYASASETPLTGETLSLAALDPVQRAELPAEDCAVLLRYAQQDWTALQAIHSPVLWGRAGARRSRLRGVAVAPGARHPDAVAGGRGDRRRRHAAVRPFGHALSALHSS